MARPFSGREAATLSTSSGSSFDTPGYPKHARRDKRPPPPLSTGTNKGRNMTPQTFTAAVEAARQALGSMAKGDAGPSTAILSQRDDVVLANPLGAPIVGFLLVAAEVARVASMFVDGDSPEFDEITRWASDDLGYVVAIEHANVQRVGSDEVVPLDLRVTTIFRREDDGWRVCVRHADRVTTPR